MKIVQSKTFRGVENFPPQFLQTIYITSIREDFKINDTVITVAVEDIYRTENIFYGIASGNDNGSFFIVPKTGDICVNKILDCKKISTYQLIVEASNGRFNGSTIVIIYVDSVSDNSSIGGV